MTNRTTPQNIDAEKAIIGCILLNTDALSVVADFLRAEHFYSPQHAIIYSSILDLFRSAKPIDVVTLTSDLKKKKKLSQVGGAAYLSELIAGAPASAYLREYAELIREASVRRSLISFSSQLEEKARLEDKQLDEILDELESNIFSLSQDNTTSEFLHTSKLIEDYFAKIEEYAKNPNALRGIPTGMKTVDDILGGLHNSDLIIIAARPSVGKSAFAFDIARHAAVNEGKSVLVFSLEMPGMQIMQRLLAQQIQVSLWDIRMGKFSDNDYAKFAEGMGKLTEAQLYVDETPGLNVMQIRSKARKLKLEKGLDMIVIDYLQLMQGRTNRADNRALEVAEISRSLKLLARELNVPVIALSQLNRSVETRGDHIPQLSDLRESGSIEQDADLVVFLSREKLFNQEVSPERQDIVDIIVAKHRNGAVGRVELKFMEKTTKFVDISK